MRFRASPSPTEAAFAGRGKARKTRLRPGAFIVMPAGHRHFAWTGPEGTTIQIPSA